MFGAVFKNTIQYTWRETILWSLGLGAVGMIVVLMLPFFEQMDFVELLEALPPVLLGAIGVGNDLTILNTPEGMMAVGFFGKMLLIFCVYPVVMGLRVVSIEEENGTMDVMLSLPVERWQIIVEKFIAYTLSIAMLSFMIFVGLAVGATMTAVELDLSVLANVAINLFPLMTFVLATTIAVGAFVSDRRTAMGIITGFVVASFMVQTVGGMLQGTLNEIITSISFFTYYDAAGVVGSGLNPVNITLLLGIAIVLIGASVWNWERRDIAV